MRRIDQQDGHGASVAARKGFMQDKGNTKAKGAGEEEPKPVPEDSGQDHFFVKAFAAMIGIRVHGFILDSSTAAARRKGNRRRCRRAGVFVASLCSFLVG